MPSRMTKLDHTGKLRLPAAIPGIFTFSDLQYFIELGRTKSIFAFHKSYHTPKVFGSIFLVFLKENVGNTCYNAPIPSSNLNFELHLG